MKTILKRIVLTLLLAAMLCSSVTLMVNAEEEKALLGDLDGNNVVSLRDALIVYKHAAKVEALEEAKQALADVNVDNIIDTSDAILIFKKAIGVIHYFPSEKIEASGTIYIAGDSIASEHDPDDTYVRQVVGWGVVIGDLFTDDVIVNNEARSGRSSMSYITSSNYNQYISKLAKGDYYFISFGHNDQKKDDPGRYTNPEGASDERGSFKWYLKNYYIDPALKVGAFPILVSSVVRCDFSGEVLDIQSHAPYAKAMEELVEEYEEQGIIVGYIDLQQMTEDYYNEVGKEEAEALHAYTATGLDTTHYCEKGARLISQMIVDDMQKQEFDICRFLRPIE